MKGLLKGFWWLFRLLKSVKYFQSYGLNKVCDIDYRKIKEMVPRKFSKIEKSVWKGKIRKNANKENLELCYRSQGDI